MARDRSRHLFFELPRAPRHRRHQLVATTPHLSSARRQGAALRRKHLHRNRSGTGLSRRHLCKLCARHVPQHPLERHAPNSAVQVPRRTRLPLGTCTHRRTHRHGPRPAQSRQIRRTHPRLHHARAIARISLVADTRPLQSRIPRRQPASGGNIA